MKTLKTRGTLIQLDASSTLESGSFTFDMSKKTWLKHTVVGFPGVSVRFVGSTGVVGGGGPTYYEKIMFKYQMREIC